MRTTLRRSCDACAKAKHGCDLKTPKCSRCLRRNVPCVYANAPAASLAPNTSPTTHDGSLARIGSRDQWSTPSPVLSASARTTPEVFDQSAGLLIGNVDSSFDPFDSYPATRVPRPQIQRLIHHFLSSIAFQYYPLDMSMDTNPFVISWWPKALADPALFHVSLQTASLDEELRAQRGFPISETLMADSVSLLRRKIEKPSLAFQDETLNAVVTLAAIEHGKGNFEASRAHIDGVLRMVSVRGGISEVKRVSPLTARMVAWVAMLVTGAPQFPTQDDTGQGDGIDPTAQWQLVSKTAETPGLIFCNDDLDPAMSMILLRLRTIFYQQRQVPLTSTDLHDLTLFIIHKLLLLPPFLPTASRRSLTSECLRYAMVLYMLIIHGTTYYSLQVITTTTLSKLDAHMAALAESSDQVPSALRLWIAIVSMTARSGAAGSDLHAPQARQAAEEMGLKSWEDAAGNLESVLWMSTPQDRLFQHVWETLHPAVAGQPMTT
ncbi:hypothetical protein CC79DRAFT_684759 [Sarocladium strictum]